MLVKVLHKEGERKRRGRGGEQLNWAYFSRESQVVVKLLELLLEHKNHLKIGIKINDFKMKRVRERVREGWREREGERESKVER